MLKGRPIQQGKIYWAFWGLFNCFIIKHTSNNHLTSDRQKKRPHEAYAALARHFESEKSGLMCDLQVLPSSESSFNCLERHRQVELNVHLACHWWILWYFPRKWGSEATLEKLGCGVYQVCMYTCIRTLLYIYIYVNWIPIKKQSQICDMVSWDKETNTLYQLLRVHPSITSPLCPHVKRPHGSETPQAQQANPSNTGEGNQGKFGPSKLKKLLGFKLRTKKQCI